MTNRTAKSRRQPGRGPMAGRRVLLLTTGLLLAAGTLLADDPVAPLPPLADGVSMEREGAEGEVRPAAFEAATSRIDHPLPLAAPDTTTDSKKPAASVVPQAGNWTFLLAIAAAFLVLAAFRLKPLRAARSLPPDVFDVLGEGSLGGQHAVRVVRFGPRTLLVAVSSAGSQTLAELTDPGATERIVAACTAGRSARGVPNGTTPPRPRPVSTVRPEPAGGEAA
jgi:flagellar biogenesis protein FliO